jgi:uncharacterized protein
VTVRRTLTNTVGFDDAPFARDARGDVRVIGVVCSRTRVDGILSNHVRRSGANATDRIVEMIETSQFREHVRAVLLQGIALAGFNVVDIHRLATTLDLPVLVVTRRKPDLPSVRHSLFANAPGPERKWKLIERAGPVEPLLGIFVQRAGLSIDEARELLRATTLHGKIPEPLRVAHLVAGGVTTGKSRGRA